MRVGIWTHLFGSLFGVRVHGTMRGCGIEIFRRLYFILYIKTSWCCNRRVSNVCQPSLLCMCVTLVVWRWSCTTNRAALLCIFPQCWYYFGYVGSKHTSAPSHIRPGVGAPRAVEIDPAAAGPTDQMPAGFSSPSRSHSTFNRVDRL